MQFVGVEKHDQRFIGPQIGLYLLDIQYFRSAESGKVREVGAEPTVDLANTAIDLLQPGVVGDFGYEVPLVGWL